MTRVLQFSKFFKPAAVLAVILTILGVVGYVHNDGFNLGIDFQAGLLQEVVFAPTAFNVTWHGEGNAQFDFDSNGMNVIVSGVGIDTRIHTFPFAIYTTAGSLADAMMYQAEGINIDMISSHPEISTQWLRNQGGAFLHDTTPFPVHYLEPGSAEISIVDVRAALDDFGLQTVIDEFGEEVIQGSRLGVSVQVLGQPGDRHFMIRTEDREEGGVRPDEVTRFLEAYFGQGEVVTIRFDYVGSRFARNLTEQAGLLVGLTLLVLLLYITARFKLQYGISLVLAVIFDTIVVIGFITWTRMEFTTSTIAAILTIIGYSTNDTIVVFDRIRETRRIYPDAPYLEVLNRALTGTLSRTIITTFSTLLAVFALYIFTTGTMQDFALALMVGMFTGVFTTTFIASGIVNALEVQKVKRAEKKKQLAHAAASR